MTIDSMPRAEVSVAKRRLLDQRLRGLGARRAPDQIPVRSGPDRAVLAPVQRGVWLANQLLPNNAVYGVHWSMWLGGQVDRHALSRAFDALVHRHEVLRTTYEETDEGPVQVVHPPAPAAVRYASAPERAGALRMAEELTRQPFDLVRGPLFTALLVSVGEREHLLLVRAHHLLVDEWSGGLLARELGELYRGFATGHDARRPALPIQYADFAQWQAGRVTGELARGQLTYWRDALSQTPPVLELPTDRPRPEVPSYGGGSVRRCLPAELSEAARELAGAHRVTLFTALLAVFAAVLHRYSGQSRLAVGSLLAGRSIAQTEDLLGVFANTVAIPVDLSGDPSFADLLDRANAAVLAAMGHQDVAFDQVVAELGVEREAARNPLFQVIFQAVEADGPAWSLGDLRVEPVSVGAAYAKVDLTLFAVTGPDGIELALTYAEDLFRPATARRLLDHLAGFLAAVVADPGARVSEVDYLTAAERERALVEWAGTAMGFPAGATVHGLVAECAARNAGRVAIRRTDGTTMSFAELDTRANQLAHHLRGLGVGRESLVGVCVPNSTDLFVALLGVLKAGAAYVPLDAALPAQRLEWILTDTAAPVVVTTAAATARIPAGYAGQLVLVDQEWGQIAQQPGAEPVPVSDADNLLYVMYTSGSTGRPKGVLVPHRGVVNYLWWAVTGYRLAGERGAPMLGSVAFDLSVPNFWLPLVGGACVTLLPEDRSLDTLARRLREPVDYSLLKITPGHLDVLRGMLEPGSVSSVRTFVVGADEVRPETVAGWRAVAPTARILNEYGPTETVVGCSVYEVPEDFDPAASIPIGRPIGNLRMYVLDHGMNPVPVGVVGELYIGGVGVARGYLHRAALTAEKFVPDPFGAPGDRLYRTGDLARYREDGNFEFLGRTDFQVKIRGYRVELGEVEARLGHHPAVAEAVATTATVAGHKRLVGYVVPVDPGAPPSTASLRAYMAETLPEYMVPTLFVTLPAMPLTAAGKVDRTALPAPDAVSDPAVSDPAASGLAASRPVAGTPGPSGEAPATVAERELAGIWREVLGVAEVGRQDNFFDLGGDSILAIKAVSRARRAGYALSAVSMFTHQTVAELAAATGPSTVVGEPVVGEPVVGEPDRPADGGVGRLSPLQAAMVLQNVADPRSGDYVEQFVFSFEGELDRAALRRAWQFAIDRHAALRTSFHWRDLPYPIYVRHDAVAAPVHEHDWRDGGPQSPARLAALLETVRGQGFPAGQPPQRLHLVRAGQHHWYLLWAFHHVLLDGWSMSIVLDDVFAAYRAFVAGQPAPALAPPVPYHRHTAWLAGRDAGADAAFWRAALAGLTGPTPISVLDPGPDGAGGHGAGGDGARPVRVERFTLSVAQAEKLREFSRRHRITLRVLLQAAWGLLLARDSRRDDVLFGTTVAGRSSGVADVERLVGMLMNTVPTRVRLDRGESVPQWLARFAAEQVTLREYEHSALAEVRRECAFPADQPLFHSVFLFDNFADDAPDLPGLRLTRVEHDHGRTGYPLVLDIADRDRLGVTLLADPQRVRPGGAGWLLTAYRKLLLELVAPDARLADVLPEPVAPEPDWQAATALRPAGASAAPAAHLPPRTATERTLAGIWSDVLGVGPIGVHDHFLLLGGDSIRAMQVVARALDAGLTLRPHHLLAHPTLVELAAFADRDEDQSVQIRQSDMDAELVARLRARYGADAVAEAYPLTPMQTGMLFHSLGGGSQYVQVFAYEIDADLDTALFERAWHVVARRHPALRTSFRWLGLDRPVQVVQAEPAVPLTVLDWREVPDNRRGERLRDLLAAELRTPFDLAAGPPLWLTLVRAGQRSWTLVWRTHHMLLDGWSGPAVLAEAWAVYEGLRATGVPPELPTPVPVGGYLAWIARQDPHADAAYWRDVLGGFAAATPLPAAEPDGEVEAAGAGRVVASVPADVVDGLQRAARRCQVTAGVLLHAMWALVLARHSGSDDVVFGTAVTGRSAPVPGVARMVGMLMNTLPVRVPVNGSTPVDAWLAGLHRQLTEVPAHEHCALAEVQRHSAVPGDRPLFETILVFNNERYGADLPAPLRRLPSPDAVGTGYPLVLDAMLADGLTLQLNYERSRYGAAAATRLLADAADMLRALAASGTASAAGGVASATPATLLAQLPALPLPAPPLPAPALPAPAVPAPPVAAPAVPDAHALAAPRSPREQTLAEIWAEVLGVARIGIHDNFFELGGDSIIAIQVVARARRAGLPIGPKQLFEHPTVARLCAVAARRQAQPVPVRADQGLVTGPVPLTPIQRWFTELDWPHDHYNQVSLLRAAQPLDPDLLDAALHRIVAHHDALRLRLTRPGAVGPDGRADRWRQHIAPDAGERGGPLLRRVDLSGLAPEQETAAMACAATAAHTSLDLAHGPLLRAVLFQGARRGAVAPADRLLVAVHHLAVDTVSWGILLEDLATAYRQLAAGTPVSLPAKTTSFQHWAYRLAEYAASERFADEAAFWRGTAPRVAALPTDRDGPHTEESTDLVSRTVPADVSATVRRGGAVRVEEALLTAMARAVKEWTGERAVGLDVERHGREPLFEDVDLLRTVGWFTAVQPLRLVLDSDDPAANLAMVAEHLRGVPHRGIGYGLTHPSTMEDAAQIVVNYHGQRAAGGAGGLFEPDPDPDPTPAGVDRAPAGIRPYLIEVDIATADGQLTVSWKYSRNRHSPGTIAALADSYLSHLRAVVTVGTPTTRDPVADRVFPGAPTLLLPAARRGLPGLSVAVVCDGALRRAFAHGTRDARHGDPLTPATLFQAGSASKQVTALGVLRLVDSGVLELDRDVNEYLTSWHPERPVTLRQLLSHRGGLSYHDYYRGYQRGGPLPTLREVLTGTGHSPNGPVRVERQPGSEYFYTGSHFSVIQQVLIDRTGEPFDALMRELVLEPLGMRDSGYGPGFAGADPSRVALGHGTTGVPYPGGWRNMAELAAAGLWTTPTDLALVAIEIQRASTGTGRLLGPEIGRQMTRQVQDSGYGLGVFVYQVAGRTRFGHGGETAGYKCLSTFDLERCAGMVIMTNGDTGREFLSEVHAELGLANAGAREGER